MAESTTAPAATAENKMIFRFIWSPLCMSKPYKDSVPRFALEFPVKFNKRTGPKWLLVIRMIKTSMNFIEVFLCLSDRTSIAFVSTNAFLGDTQTLFYSRIGKQVLFCSPQIRVANITRRRRIELRDTLFGVSR